jgi:hypothetical protein
MNLAESTTILAADSDGQLRTLIVQRDSASGQLRLVDANHSISYQEYLTSTSRYFDWTHFSYVSRADVDLAIIEPGSNGFDPRAVDAYVNVRAAYDYYAGHFGRDSYDGHGGDLLVILEDNDGAWARMGRLRFGWELTDALDVVGHEYTHAVMTSIITRGSDASLPQGPQANALNEAYADIFGVLIEAKAHSSDRWTIGEDQTALTNENGEYGVRNLQNPEQFATAANMRYYSPLDESGHYNSTIFSHAAYLMMTNDATVEVTDSDWASIYYRSLGMMGTDATFLEARDAVVVSAKLQGLSEEEVGAVRQAFNQVGITEPVTVKIELTWGASPSDLDSHLVGPTANEGQFHVYYGNKEYSVLDSSGKTVHVADLDYDDTSAYGPERTTIRKLEPGTYYFYVHNFSDRSSGSSTAMSTSRATVRVTTSDYAINDTFEILPSSEGIYWTVARIEVADTGTITVTPVNDYGYSAPSTSVV